MANFITGRQAELNMANAREIAQEEADDIHSPKLVEEQNEQAMGADDLLASDTFLAAGDFGARSVVIHVGPKSSALVGHAAASLANARAKAGVTSGSATVAEDLDGAVLADDQDTADIADDIGTVADEPAADVVGSDEDPAQ